MVRLHLLFWVYQCASFVFARTHVRGVAITNEPAAQELIYHSVSNGDTCANAFYNKYACAR